MKSTKSSKKVTKKVNKENTVEGFFEHADKFFNKDQSKMIKAIGLNLDSLNSHVEILKLNMMVINDFLTSQFKKQEKKPAKKGGKK